MKILAIDPGNEQSAFVIYNDIEQVIIDRGKFDNKLLLSELNMLAYSSDISLFEVVQSYGMGVGRTTFLTCIWVGRFTQRLEDEGFKTIYFGRPTIAGHLGAKGDAQIRACLRMRLCSCGSKGACKKGCKLHGLNVDERSALALAVAYSENRGLKEW